MSIRYKVLTGMLLVFVLNILLLGGYYQVVLRVQIAGSLHNAQAQLESAAEYVSELLADHPGDAYEELLSGNQELQHYDITLTNTTDGELLYCSPASHTGDVQFYAAKLVHHDGNSLLLKVYRQYTLNAAREIAIVQKLILAEVWIIAALLMGMGIMMQYEITHPLIALNRRMQDYRKGLSGTDHRRRKRHDELGQLEQEFDRMTHDLDEEKRVQGQIIASISHDIKTPLTSVMGYVERLMKGGGSVIGEQRAQQYLEIIYQRAQNIDELIDEFDAYLGSNPEMSPLRLQPVRGEDFCNWLTEEYQAELAGEGVTLIVENQAADLSFFIDLSKARRVFGNLIGNSVKYAETDNLSIEITCTRQDKMIQFTVADNGKGVPEEELVHIFEPFYTMNASRGSRGLGLSICRSIVEAHGGNIRALAGQSGGLAVVMQFPLK